MTGEGGEIWDTVWRSTVALGDAALVDETLEEEASDRCRQIVRFVEAHATSGAGLSIVELGCGSAIYGCIFARRGARVTVLDQSGTALERTRERARALGVEVELVEGDILGFVRARREGFDVAMSFGTVEHFRSPMREDLCTAHVDAVRPGGIVVISVPNLLFLPHELLKQALILRKKWLLGYEGSFTPWELRRVGRRLGLREARVHGSEVGDDMRRYVRIVAGTGLARRWLPAWVSAARGPVHRTSVRPEFGRLSRLVNRCLGRDITLLGVKAG